MIDSLSFNCPHCGAPNSASLDYSQGDRQEWITDCEVCCHPLVVNVTMEDDQIVDLYVRKEDE